MLLGAEAQRVLPRARQADVFSILLPQHISAGRQQAAQSGLTAPQTPQAISLSVGKLYARTFTFQTSQTASITETFPVVAFIAHLNAVDQTGVADVTWTQITGLVEQADVGGDFASNAWTPPAGKVRLGVLARGTGAINATTGVCGVAVYKNGSVFGQDFAIGSTNDSLQMGVIVDDSANGTDAYTARIYIDVTTGTGTVNGASYYTRFWGYFIGT